MKEFTLHVILNFIRRKILVNLSSTLEKRRFLLQFTIVDLRALAKHQAGCTSTWRLVYLSIRLWMQSMVNRRVELELV